jgi:hypothetical protein
MKLVIESPRGTTQVAWSDFALLRDNVQHYLESSPDAQRYVNIHAFERAVDRGSAVVDALQLRSEVQRAWDGLKGLELGDSAVSLRTRAILTGCAEAPPVRGSVLARHAQWELPVQAADSASVQSAVRSFVTAILEATDYAADGENLRVVVAGQAQA